MTQEVINRSNNDLAQMSFHQKSTLLSLLITITAAIYYVAYAWQFQPAAELTGTIPVGFGSLIIKTAVVITLTQIVLQIVLAFGSGSAPAKTANEAAAELKAQRNSYFVLVFTLLVGITSFWINSILFYPVNLLIIGFIVSEIVKLASELFYGRKKIEIS